MFIVSLQRKKQNQTTYIHTGTFIRKKNCTSERPPELSANILFLADKKVPVCMFFGTFAHLCTRYKSFRATEWRHFLAYSSFSCNVFSWRRSQVMQQWRKSIHPTAFFSHVGHRFISRASHVEYPLGVIGRKNLLRRIYPPL